MADDLATLAGRFRAARRITILTGAGVSAASGVPTFRGTGGLWRSVRAEDLATLDAFRRDPRLVWEWYAWRRELIAACRPNPAHEVIARWSAFARAARVPADPPAVQVRVITQNVDDLHVRAGTQGLIRLHGSIWEMSCAGRGPSGGLKASGYRSGEAPRDAAAGVDGAAGGLKCSGRSESEGHGWPGGCGAAWRDERVPLPALPPRCDSCGGLARPAVVWFGESLAPDDVDAAIQACQCDLFLAIGTSALVYPAAGLAHEAARRGAFTVEVNAEATPASAAVNLAIRGAAEDILPRLDRLLASA